MKLLKDLPNHIDARVIIRVDYNVPFKNNRILDDRRIAASYKTIDAVIKKGGTPVLIAHRADSEATLRPVAQLLANKYNIVFVTEAITSKHIVTILEQVPKKTLILLENIRRYPQEERNNKTFAKAIARLGSYYVNDAFSVSHRKHASVVGIASILPSYAGMQLVSEIASLSKALNKPKHPFVFILGGAKFSTKIPLIERFIKTADSVVVTGAILNNFYKVAGFEVGSSVVESGYDKKIKVLLKESNLLLPVDVIVLRSGSSKVVTLDEVVPGDSIVDIGPRSVALIGEKIASAKMIVWNGPTGWYEKGFTKATVTLAKKILETKALTIIGGGDTGVVVEKALKKNPAQHIFISTGGGATLEYLSKGSLPGIDALN